MKEYAPPGAPRSISEKKENATDVFREIEGELTAGLTLYWSTAARMLEGSGTRLSAPPQTYFDPEENFFSALFLYSYYRAGIPAFRRTLYAAVNQCLRGIVTGCDNLLDDEYKTTLVTDLPQESIRFRSILDMLTSDRVLFDLLFQAYRRKELTAEELRTANAVSLRTLVPSGAQEASEERGIRERLPPETILQSVHHFKTGLLFQSPWAVPSALENPDEATTAPLLKALYDLGMGCQILDDMVDLRLDLKRRSHNYVLSLIHHRGDPSDRKRLRRLTRSPNTDDPGPPSDLFPSIRQSAADTALDYLNRGLGLLFSDHSPIQVSAAIEFLVRRIGASSWIFPNGT